MGIFDKAKDLLGTHGDKVADGVDKATDVADDKTGGKYSEHLDKVDDYADKMTGQNDDTAEATDDEAADEGE